MRRLVFSVMLVVAANSVVAAPAPFPRTQRPDRQSDRDRLQGEWVVIESFTWVKGNWIQSTIHADVRVVVRGDRMDWFVRDANYISETFTLSQLARRIESTNLRTLEVERGEYSLTQNTFALVILWPEQRRCKVTLRKKP